MAKGKGGSNKTSNIPAGPKVSAGPSKSRWAGDPNYSMQRAMNQLNAWKRGKNVVLTVPNPDKSDTSARYIKVNARDYWGSPFKKQQSAKRPAETGGEE
tara:strand:- start:1465 stop:1761 length:297 start_codon:yes stop_codon:yes gene_type:complete